MQPSAPGPDPTDDQVLQYTHSGSTYLLGYGRTFFGIWQRSDPTRPVERFPRDDDGWAAAWRRFTAIEANYAEVGLGSGVVGPRRRTTRRSLLRRLPKPEQPGRPCPRADAGR